MFLYAGEEIGFEIIKKVPGIYKVLDYDVGFKELQGNDYKYAMWIYNHQGHIGTSKVLAEGRTVKVIDGPLLDGLGTIVNWISTSEGFGLSLILWEDPSFHRVPECVEVE